MTPEPKISKENFDCPHCGQDLRLSPDAKEEMKAKEAEIERLEQAVANIGIEHSILVEEAQAERSRFLELQKHTEALVKALDKISLGQHGLSIGRTQACPMGECFCHRVIADDAIAEYRKSFPKGGREK